MKNFENKLTSKLGLFITFIFAAWILYSLAIQNKEDALALSLAGAFFIILSPFFLASAIRIVVEELKKK